MEFTAALGLDLAAVIIVLYCAVTAAKKGFLRTVVQMIAYVAVLLAASFLSRAAAPVLYDQLVLPMLEQRGGIVAPEEPKPNAQLVSASPGGVLAWETPQDAMDSITGLLPENIDPEAFAHDLLDDLSDATLRPMAISAIQAIAFVAVFALLSLLTNLLLSALGVISYLPVVGTLDAALGCLVGIAQGALLVWLLALLLQGILYLYPQGWWLFSRSMIDDTFVFQYFMNPGLLRNLG